MRNIWFSPIFFSPRDSNKKGLLGLLNLGLESVTDPKGRFASFKATASRVFCVYDPSWGSTRERLARGRFFQRLENYMKNKNEGNENKIIIGDFNCTLDKIERDCGNKIQTL